MSEINYKGSTIQSLYKLSDKFPDYTLGQLFHTFLRGKKLNTVTDEEIYQSIETSLKESDDETMTDEDFERWKNKVLK